MPPCTDGRQGRREAETSDRAPDLLGTMVGIRGGQGVWRDGTSGPAFLLVPV